MNKRLFEIRNLGRRPILWIVVAALVVVSALFICQLRVNNKKNFLKFHGQSDYSPLNENGKGFYGKVNSFLQKALTDKSDSIYSIAKLDVIYKRLRFYYPIDTTDYLVSVDDIRLIDFIPDSLDPDEAEFYFNSDFRNAIERQKSNLTQQYFNIEWNRAKDSILSITINSNLFNLALQNNNWLGTINFVDPFSKIDPQAKYLVLDQQVVPLFKSNIDTNTFFRSECRWIDINPARVNKYSITEYEEFYAKLNRTNVDSSRTFKILYDDVYQSPEHSVRLLNTGEHILIQSQATDLRIYGGSKTIIAGHDTTIVLAGDISVWKVIIKLRGHDREYAIYISDISPFSVASKPINEGMTSERVGMDTSFMDLFSLQQVNQLESSLSSKDSINKVELSTNILLSKFLENKIKEKVNTLYSDNRYSQRPDDIFEMSVSLMDISTGEIIAAPFYSNEFGKNNINELSEQRNFNLEKHDIGSTFKPLLSFAAILKYRSLLDFMLLPSGTRYISESNCQVVGYETQPYGLNKITKQPNRLAFWSGAPVNLQQYLSSSHDNYPVAQTMIALTEQSDSRAFDLLTHEQLNNTGINNLYQLNGDNASRILFRPGRLRTVFKDVSNSSFVNIISNLYDVLPENKDSTYNTITYDTKTWDSLEARKTLFALYPDLVYLGTERFGHANPGVSDFKKFELFVLGQGDNRWTNLKLAEAYSRLLSKRKVNATFLKSDVACPNYLFQNPKQLFNTVNNNHFDFNVTPATINQSWERFVNTWSSAVRDGGTLLRPAYNQFCRAVPDNNRYHFYCKTGTPQENDEHTNDKVFKKGASRIWWDEGVFVFGITSLDMIYPKGVVGVVYIKHLSLNKVVKGVESSTARDFVTPEIFEKIMFYNRNRFNP